MALTSDLSFTIIDKRKTRNVVFMNLFIAAVSSDNIQLVKLYPEGNAETRLMLRGVKRIFFYCNHDGLFSIDPVKGIDDKESGYDDIQERKELEKAAAILFG